MLPYSEEERALVVVGLCAVGLDGHDGDEAMGERDYDGRW